MSDLLFEMKDEIFGVVSVDSEIILSQTNLKDKTIQN